MSDISEDRRKETNRRRTFAIISHPDAGKTTITEKLLFHGGAIRQTGEVKGKSGTKAATSDWMSMEQERGVSITSSVMQFDYEGLRVNLLDTPGHKDFGEDTYRTLVAADCSAMLIDAAKGVEAQTRKLYEVCRLRKLPIFTFANKMDREGKEPLELIDDVEKTLQIKCYPVTWPIGMGDRFRGLYHRLRKQLFLFKKGTVKPTVIDVDWEKNPEIIRDHVGQELFDIFNEELELMEIAIGEFSEEEFLRGDVSPMTFGSAKFNWGVDLFLELFAQHAPSPHPVNTEEGQVNPHDKTVSAFVFKIQANMDRRHRDRIAFLRICSGQFERGMKVHHPRIGREIRLSYASQFFAQERDTVETAYPGDIVGVIDTGYFRIGDSLTTGKNITFKDIPRFSPEIFGRLSIKDPLKRKTLQKGVQQLSEEGAVQLFFDPHLGKQDPVLGVVGELQFDVLMHRLREEYRLEVRLDRLPFSVARWPRLEDGAPVHSLQGGGQIFHDESEQPVVLLEKEWDLRWLERENPDVHFHITGG